MFYGVFHKNNQTGHLALVGYLLKFGSSEKVAVDLDLFVLKNRKFQCINLVWGFLGLLGAH
jgi:hypothetical protein